MERREGWKGEMVGRKEGRHDGWEGRKDDGRKEGRKEERKKEWMDGWMEGIMDGKEGEGSKQERKGKIKERTPCCFSLYTYRALPGTISCISLHLQELQQWCGDFREFRTSWEKKAKFRFNTD